MPQLGFVLYSICYSVMQLIDCKDTAMCPQAWNIATSGCSIKILNCHVKKTRCTGPVSSYLGDDFLYSNVCFLSESYELRLPKLF